MQEGKVVGGGDLTKSQENKGSKNQKRKRKIYSTEFQRITNRDKKSF